jgi:serine/threonine protein kinase
MESIFDRFGYCDLELLGEGRHGTVYSAIKTENEEAVVIKELKSDRNLDRKLREIEILAACNHPNMLRLIQSFEIDDQLYIVMERLDFTLQNFLEIEYFMNHDQIKYLMYQLVSGLLYAHRKDIMHRDIKPDNILLRIRDPDNPLRIKIADFSLARYGYTHQDYVSSDPTRPKLTKFNDLFYWSAPELILKEENYEKSVDIWSLGCIYGEMLNTMKSNICSPRQRAPLFKRNATTRDLLPREFEKYVTLNEYIILDMICQFLGTPDCSFLQNSSARELMDCLPRYTGLSLEENYPACLPEELEILSKLLKFNPKDRISLEELIKMPYFDAFRNLGYHEMR